MRRSHYIYRRPVRRSHYSNFRRYLLGASLFIGAAGVIVFFIYEGLHKQSGSSPKSAVQNTVISGAENTFTNDYFQFKDSGTWVIDKNDSNASRIVYHKFRKNVQQHEMIFYINQDPIPLYVAVPRALPLHIVNGNSLAATNVSSPCVSQYATGEPHKVKTVSINGAEMLCDPDSPQYFVILSEINGDYHLHLKRPNGTPIEFVITYKDTSLDTNATDLLNVVNSFQVR